MITADYLFIAISVACVVAAYALGRLHNYRTRHEEHQAFVREQRGARVATFRRREDSR